MFDLLKESFQVATLHVVYGGIMIRYVSKTVSSRNSKFGENDMFRLFCKFVDSKIVETYNPKWPSKTNHSKNEFSTFTSVPSKAEKLRNLRNICSKFPILSN